MNFEEKTRRLVFHFYVPKKWKELKSIEVHLNCLRHYSFIFDEALFVISVDDIKDKELIIEFEHEILNLGFNGNITFITEQNTILYEAKTLKEQIVDKLEVLDGITFFGHSKGIGNEMFNSCSWEQLEAWITGMYFMGLEYYREAVSKLYGVWSIAYGPFKSSWDELDNKNHWIYSGTFFWLNCQRLHDKIKRENLQVRHCNDRFYSEHFLGDLLPFNKQTDYPNIAASHRESYLTNANYFYDYVSYYIELILGGNDLKEYYKFKEKVKAVKNVKEEDKNKEGE